MTDRIITTDRCTAVLDVHYRPRLAAVVAALIARQSPPASDWRCVRSAHTMGPTDSHLAMPLGPTGRSVWFPAYMEQPAAPDCDNPACQHSQNDHDADGNCTLCPCAPADDLPDDGYVAEPDPALDLRDADPAPGLAALVDQLARANVGVVRCEPGDTLLLLVDETPAPLDDEDDDPMRRLVADLRELVPSIAVVVLAGVNGAVVVPAPEPFPVHPFSGEPGGLCRIRFGTRQCDLPGSALGHVYPPAPDLRYVPPFACRVGCGEVFATDIARGRHEGPTGPHMMRRP